MCNTLTWGLSWRGGNISLFTCLTGSELGGHEGMRDIKEVVRLFYLCLWKYILILVVQALPLSIGHPTVCPLGLDGGAPKKPSQVGSCLG